MKTCISCGRELPDESAFCPFCETEQTSPEPVKVPRVWRRRVFAGLLAAAVLLAAGAVLYAVLRPRTFESKGAELTYRGYRLVLRMTAGPDLYTPEPAVERTVAAHSEYAFPARIYIYRGNGTDSVWEEFSELVSSYTLQAIPKNGAKAMEVGEPAHIEVFPGAYLCSDVGYDTECGENELCWTLYMKNGDTLILRQSLTIHATPEVSYYYTETDMHDMAALQALLEEIDGTVPRDTLVSLYLPPVEYAGKLTLTDRAYFFYGSSDGASVTTFTDTVTVDTETPTHVEFHAVRFQGSGGIGIQAGRGVCVFQCKFSGWDIAATATDGAWLSVHSSRFTDNRIGIQVNSLESVLVSPVYDNCLFADNGIAFHALHVVKGISEISFTNSVFRGNDVNVQNDAGVSIDLYEAVIE